MKKRWIILVVVLLAGIAGAWLGHRKLKAVGHPGLGTFLSQWWNNYPKSFAMDPPSIALEVKPEGMERLEAVVDSARQRGVIMPEGNDYVKGKFTVDGQETKCKLRIKGKLSDHVKDEKWSFRVIAKGDGGFLGMKRFSLQHPGTRNYLCDWFYHQLSKGEGIVALRYGFCKVSLNGDNLGVYAYEEHFGPELLENNGRLKGPLVRFDPGLYWVHRLNGMQDLDFEEAYADYQAAALDAFESDELVNDPQQLRYFQLAMYLIDGFRRGELTAAQVFDVEKMAARHAIIDLVGGHHSMDWSDVKFYYDPAAQRLEPISYESFSAFPTKKLAGSGRYTGKSNAGAELHDALFNDADFFAAYVRALERMSRNEYLDSTFTAIAGALDTASATLYGEFPYKELDRSIYYKNQEIIRRSLEVPKAVHAHLQGQLGDRTVVKLVSINSLPVEVLALRLGDGTAVKPTQRTIVPARRAGGLGDAVLAEFPAAQPVDTLTSKISLMCAVLGSQRQMETEVFPVAKMEPGAMDAILAHEQPNVGQFPFAVMNDSAMTIHFKPGSWKLVVSMVVPAGYVVHATSPLSLEMVGGARIISYSPLVWKGSEESHIRVFSADSSSNGIHVISAGGGSDLSFVDFDHLCRFQQDQTRSADLSFHRSSVSLTNCSFSGTSNTLLDVSVGNATMSGCSFTGGSDQLELHHVRGQVRACRFQDAADDALSIEGGVLDAKECEFTRAKGIGVKATSGAVMKFNNVRMAHVGQGIEVRAGSSVHAKGGSIEAVHAAVVAGKASMRDGAARVVLDGVKLTAAGTPTVCGAGSSVVLNGKELGALTNAEPQAEVEE
ncbi:MAG: CotH kinase family protein [Flavobacteriales bacterium]|nr:MAG: CotH kinase family protein [Flavobacteriales bacterium]